MSETIIRDLRVGDMQAVAHIHLAAFPRSALGQLGKEAVARYYQWQLEGPHDAVALGSFIEQDLAGFCFAGIFRGALSGFLRKNRGFLVWRVITHPWLVITPLFRERLLTARGAFTHRPAPAVPVTSSPPRSFGVLSIAVNPGRQGLGVGRQLMMQVEKVARERGYLNMHLTVAIDNVQAAKFYEKLDWHKVIAPNGNWLGAMEKHLES